MHEGNIFSFGLPNIRFGLWMMEIGTRSFQHLMIPLLVVVFYAPVTGQTHVDSFEGGAVRFQLVESDCQSSLTEHEISLTYAHSGRTSELVGMDCLQGTQAVLAYPIEPCLVLDEFTPMIWVRSSSGRVQLGVRVVFPYDSHPVTGGRLTVLLWGESYAQPGQWQLLTVRHLKRQLQQAVIGMRQRFGAELRLEGEYIDTLVVNGYTGPGHCRMQFDDLDLLGHISVAALGSSLAENWQQRWKWREVMPRDDQRFWTTRNMPDIFYEYQGESMAWLSSLGVEGIFITSFPSESQLHRVADAGLRLLCAAPSYPVVLEDGTSDVISGWMIGSALDDQQYRWTQDQVTRVSKLPEGLNRPTFVETLESFWRYSRLADETIVPVPAIVSAPSFSAKQRWLQSQLTTTRQRGSGWVSIARSLPSTWLRQYDVAWQLVNDGQVDGVSGHQPRPSDPLAMRYQAVGAILGGARGILWRGDEPLELNIDGGAVEAAALRWIHHDLELWGPWIMAGVSNGTLVLDRPDYRGTAWSVSQSQLIVAQHEYPLSPSIGAPTATQPLRVQINAGQRGLPVFRLTEGQLERVETIDDSLQVVWQIDRPQPIEVFVVASNASVLQYLEKQLGKNALSVAEDQLEIAGYLSASASELCIARFPAGSQAGREQMSALQESSQTIELGYAEIRRGNASEAIRRAAAAFEQVQGLLYEGYMAATADLAQPQSSPFVLNPVSLSLHWKLADACQRSVWRELRLPGGEFSDLQEMLELGWSQQRRTQDAAELRAEVLSRPPSTNTVASAGLRLAAYAKTQQGLPGGYEGALMRVRSSSLPVKAGQLVRIMTKAKVLKAPQDAMSGLLIYDNQAGPVLGQLVQGDVGDEMDIQLYRFVVADGDFHVLAEVRGECDIVVTSVRASVIEPAQNRQNYTTSPAQMIYSDGASRSSQP